jgi:molybdenum cofactor guanylyltransferase
MTKKQYDAQKNSLTGVVLAGGQSKRMQYMDKGLVPFLGKPMINYAIQAMLPHVDQVVINANRSHDAYQLLGCPVIEDEDNYFNGPLSGILSVLNNINTASLLVMPCDCPMISSYHVQQMLEADAQNKSDITVAMNNGRLLSVFLVIKKNVRNSLVTYLERGDRKVVEWIVNQKYTAVSFSDAKDIFFNINTFDELKDLEKKLNW